MNNDNRQINRILSRRQALALIRATGAATFVGCLPRQTGSAQPPLGTPTLVPARGAAQASSAATMGTWPTCTVTPELTEGPYFVDEQLKRSDIRLDPSNGSVKEGVPLQLALRVSQISSNRCAPLTGAIVDIWHCDALGVYSDVRDPGFSTVGQKFLRGYQVTDVTGTVHFATIYPGWYQGRTVHIHFKVRTDSVSDKRYEFTSQLFFDDAITDRVHAQKPYASKGQRTLKNDGDGIFRSGGEQLLLKTAKAGQGYAATFDIGLQMV